MDRTPHEMPNTCDACSEARTHTHANTHLGPSARERALFLICCAVAARAKYCLRGRWHCGGCDDFDLCAACYAAYGPPLPLPLPLDAELLLSLAPLPAPPRWAHAHPREGFTLEEAPSAEEEEDCAAADAAADAAAEMDAAAAADADAGADAPQLAADAPVDAPDGGGEAETARALAPAFEAERVEGDASGGGA